jgi:hypothetical protein
MGSWRGVAKNGEENTVVLTLGALCLGTLSKRVRWWSLPLKLGHRWQPCLAHLQLEEMFS